jgi:hypothetical protein
VFRFALVSTDGDALGPVAFACQDFKPGDTIPQGRGASLRVVRVIEPENDGELPLLVVERVECALAGCVADIRQLELVAI